MKLEHDITAKLAADRNTANLTDRDLAKQIVSIVKDNINRITLNLY